jgi:uncharacterized integral membrane protein (TIGR00697 family)
MATIIANIEVVKSIDLFGIEATLGNVIYGSVFLATDILNEKYGKKEAQRGVFVGFASMVAFVAMTQVNLLYTPNEYDFAQRHMQALFSFLPRIAFASMLAYIISQLLDTNIYQWVREKTGGKYLFLRNNISTMIGQMIDSILFTAVAFVGVFEPRVVVMIGVSTYLLKVVIAVVDTPFLYLAARMHQQLD